MAFLKDKKGFKLNEVDLVDENNTNLNSQNYLSVREMDFLHLVVIMFNDGQ
jgi:hypothetical protein